jgi:hypothetical protein
MISTGVAGVSPRNMRSGAGAVTVVRATCVLGVTVWLAQTWLGGGRGLGGGGGGRGDRGSDGGDVSSSGTVSSGPMPAGPTGPEGWASGWNVVSPEPAVDLRPERWSDAQPVPGEPEVLVRATLTSGPPYAVLGRVDVVETADSVTITLWVGRRENARGDGPQAALGYPLVTRVRLAAPVGTRQLRDGAA